MANQRAERSCALDCNVSARAHPEPVVVTRACCSPFTRSYPESTDSTSRFFMRIRAAQDALYAKAKQMKEYAVSDMHPEPIVLTQCSSRYSFGKSQLDVEIEILPTDLDASAARIPCGFSVFKASICEPTENELKINAVRAAMLIAPVRRRRRSAMPLRPQSDSLNDDVLADDLERRPPPITMWTQIPVPHTQSGTKSLKSAIMSWWNSYSPFNDYAWFQGFRSKRPQPTQVRGSLACVLRGVENIRALQGAWIGHYVEVEVQVAAQSWLCVIQVECPINLVKDVVQQGVLKPPVVRAGRQPIEWRYMNSCVTLGTELLPEFEPSRPATILQKMIKVVKAFQRLGCFSEGNSNSERNHSRHQQIKDL
ncbi:hypothetical protein BCR37DRAFT_319773 [Protomyces lactucae-debilis]|uniref:Uncharacterized protein n=1 Tax=Protomyces lactucae-debilis TaxID=2754530 RepID=A0A1Y2FH15_PROLT|nr:uncharacterized protein BCR37DRAFT_319773 [Protomyces lactucae-debilis]ORY82694.1 hypothetical protein BCR37DRAFT_319773 [Protomyces lactucae-debilis]